MENSQSHTFTVIALDDKQTSVTGFRYIARLQPLDGPDFWFQAEGQFTIWAAITNSGITFKWLSVEHGINEKGSWKGPIQADRDQLNKLKNAVNPVRSSILG